MISGRNQYHIDERDWILSIIKFKSGIIKGLFALVVVQFTFRCPSTSRSCPSSGDHRYLKKENRDLHILFKASFRSGCVRAEISSQLLVGSARKDRTRFCLSPYSLNLKNYSLRSKVSILYIYAEEGWQSWSKLQCPR